MTIILSLVVQMALAVAVMFGMLALTHAMGTACACREWRLDPDRRLFGDNSWTPPSSP